MSSQHVRPIEILLVEDNPADLRLTVEMLREGKLSNHLEVVRDGTAAMAYLRRDGDYAEAARPDLVLLDLDLPGTDGRSILAEIKGDPTLYDIRVVVLIGSRQHEDMLSSYDLKADGYFVKPLDAGALVDLVRQIDGLWLSIVELA